MDATELLIATGTVLLAAGGLVVRVQQIAKKLDGMTVAIDLIRVEAASRSERLAVMENRVDAWTEQFAEFRTEMRELLSGIGTRNEERWNKIELRMDGMFRKMGEG